MEDHLIRSLLFTTLVLASGIIIAVGIGMTISLGLVDDPTSLYFYLKVDAVVMAMFFVAFLFLLMIGSCL